MHALLQTPSIGNGHCSEQQIKELCMLEARMVQVHLVSVLLVRSRKVVVEQLSRHDTPRRASYAQRQEAEARVNRVVMVSRTQGRGK